MVSRHINAKPKNPRANLAAESKPAAPGAKASSLGLPEHKIVPSQTPRDRQAARSSGAPRMLPAKSVKRATNAFKNFSLSQFPGGTVPSTYVTREQVKSPAAVAAAQRKTMSAALTAMTGPANQNVGLSLALPPAQITSLLPSFKNDTGAVDLSDLVNLLTQRMRGKQFYASGNPTLNRVVNESRLLSQVQAFISNIKAGGA